MTSKKTCVKGRIRGVNLINMITQKDLDLLKKTLATKYDLKKSISDLKSDMFDKFDAFIKEVRDSHEERVIMSGQISDLNDRVDILETRHTN